MSHKTRYKTFSQPDLTTLETAVNEHIRSLYKDEKLAGVRVDNITTFSINNIFVAALTYSYGKKKKPEAQPLAATEEVPQVAE